MKKVFNLLIVMAIAASSMTSCLKPYQEKKYEIIQPNETAFVIPLEQNNKSAQGKLNSETFLNENKVASKRIEIPTRWHQSGRLSNSGEWIPSVRVIKVNRAPVTREWTAANGSGTKGNKKEDIEVESMESIGFGIGITATASIPEEWAAKFLYNYNGRSLAQVMDNDVRAYIQNILTSNFGSRNLSRCQSERKAVFDTMRIKTTKYFATMGVRVMNIGAAGQFNYTDKKIQIAINEKFASEMKKTTSMNEVAAAKKFAQAMKEIKAQKELDADNNIKDAIADAIRSGKLTLPNQLTMVGNETSAFDLFTVKSLK